jgi:hypothetical protein
MILMIKYHTKKSIIESSSNLTPVELANLMESITNTLNKQYKKINKANNKPMSKKLMDDFMFDLCIYHSLVS